MSTVTRSAPQIQASADGAAIKVGGRFSSHILAAFIGFVYLLLWVVFLELLFRLGHFGEQEYLKVDPVLGMTHLENKLVTDRSEAFAVSKINSAGNCDREHDLFKAPGVFRIAVLGDSMTEAIQVPNEERFCSLLEKELNARKTGLFEVINFGNSAFSTGQEYLQFLERVKPYKPDLTILMFHQGDQEKNAPLNSAWSLRPTFTIDKNQKVSVRWIEFDNWRSSTSALPLTMFDFGRRHSRIWGVLLQTQSDLKKDRNFKALSDRFFGISKVLRKFVHVNGSESNLNIHSNGALIAQQDIEAARNKLCQSGDLGVDRSKLDPLKLETADKWGLTLTLIEKLNLSCKQSGSKFLIASLPAFENRDTFKKQFKLIETLGTAGDFATTDLTPAFEQAANQDTDSLFLTGHLSARGHELVSDRLLKKVIK